jgi:hypothetical protein
VSRLLLHARRPLTFRLGEIGEGEGGILLVEIAADAAREALFSLLKPLENTLLLRVRQIGWGWPITAAKESSGERREISGPLRADPYGGAAAQTMPVRSYTQGRGQIVRRVASLALTAGMVVAFVGILFRAGMERGWLADHEASITLLWFSIWFLWVFLRVPLIPFRRSGYVTRITCDAQGIEVRDWFARRGRRLMWKDIWGLDLRYEECVVRASGRTLSFPTSDVLGPQDLPMLIKTILERSALLFVGGTMSPLQYRRFDAPS